MTEEHSSLAELMDELAAQARDVARAARDVDGAPVDALAALAADAESIANCGVTVAEFESMRQLYEGMKVAGLLPSQQGEEESW